MKIVLDSNVIVAAFAAHGICHLVMENCLHRHRVLTSDFILHEVSEKLAQKIHLPAWLIRETDQYLREHTVLHNPGTLAGRLSRDPDDDNILALAEEGEAQYIVTDDKDLLALEVFKGIPILTPRQFADVLRTPGI